MQGITSLLIHIAQDPTRHSISEKIRCLCLRRLWQAPHKRHLLLYAVFITAFLNSWLLFTLHSLRAVFPAGPWHDQLTSLTEALTMAAHRPPAFSFSFLPHSTSVSLPWNAFPIHGQAITFLDVIYQPELPSLTTRWHIPFYHVYIKSGQPMTKAAT